MRSDWDPDHRQRGDMQKRYPDITRDEWVLLLGCARNHRETLLDHLPPTPPSQIRAAARLIAKIEARLVGET